jgi:hypothetical protein
MDPAINTTLQTANGWVTLPCSLKRPDGGPRFDLSFPLYLVSDAGAVHLIANETNSGYEPPTRDLIERTLRRGDLFVDVGAHWGFFTLQAATHPAGEIEVVAFEPELMNAIIFSENITRNKLSNVIAVCALWRRLQTGAAGDEFLDASRHLWRGHALRWQSAVEAGAGRYTGRRTGGCAAAFATADYPENRRRGV